MSAIIYDDFKESDIDPTHDQLDWLSNKLDKVKNLFRSRGAKHIEDLTKDKHCDSLRVEGGTGYTVKFLGQDWSVYMRDPSLHPIPELQDIVAYLSSTTQTYGCSKSHG